MEQKPIVMEQLKQILQLKNDGISIREIARRVHISRNSVRKYLSRCDAGTDNLSDKQLADKAYNNEQLQTNTERKLQLLLALQVCRIRAGKYKPSSADLFNLFHFNKGNKLKVLRKIT